MKKDIEVVREEVQAALDARTPYDLAMTFFAIAVAKIDRAVLAVGDDPLDLPAIRAGLEEGLRYAALARETLAREGLACDERYDAFVVRCEKLAAWLRDSSA